MRRIFSATVLAIVACSSGTEPNPTPPPGNGNVNLRLEQIASGFAAPVYVTSPPGDSRLFVVEQNGRVRVILNGQVLSTAFIDVVDKIAFGGETGLLSVAFHPQFATNGFAYVFYTSNNSQIRVERYTVSSNPNVANPSSAKLILSLPRTRLNHNGGLAMFGPDGMLYLGIGDGGGGGDPDRNGQDINTLQGSLLRVNVDGGDPYSIPSGNPFAGRNDAKGELWAIGLRNPWRFSFDRVGGNLYVADVGQDRLEEINIVPSTRAGVNYGWNVMEASTCFQASSCNRTGLEVPIVEYDHAGGNCSVTGGFVYRGSAIPEIAGHYFYGDYCGGWVRSFRFANGTANDAKEWSFGDVGAVTSFGEDSSGELYITTGEGRVYKIVKSASP